MIVVWSSRVLRMRIVACVGVLGWLGLLLSGCGPAVSPNELGTVVYTVPDVPGAEKPYSIPDIPPPPEVVKAKQEFSVPPKPPSAKPAER